MMHYDSRIEDCRFFPVIPLPVAIGITVSLNAAIAVFGNDPEPVFQKAQQDLLKLEEFFPEYTHNVKVYGWRPPYAMHILATKITFSEDGIPVPKTPEEYKLLSSIVMYKMLSIVGGKNVESAFSGYDFTVYPAEASGSTFENVMESVFEIALPKGHADHFIDLCEKRALRPQLGDINQLILNFKDYEGLANSGIYKGYHWQGAAYSPDVPHLISVEKMPGLGEARNYALRLSERIEK